MNQDERNASAPVKRFGLLGMSIVTLALIYLGSYGVVRAHYQRELPRKPTFGDPPGPFLGTAIAGKNNLLQHAVYVVYFPLGRLEGYLWGRPYFLIRSSVSDPPPDW